MLTLPPKEKKQLQTAYQEFVRMASAEPRSKKIAFPTSNYKTELIRARNSDTNKDLVKRKNTDTYYSEAITSLRGYISALQSFQLILENDIREYQSALTKCESVRNALLRAADRMKLDKNTVVRIMDDMEKEVLRNRKSRWDEGIQRLQKTADDIVPLVQMLVRELKTIESERAERKK